MISIKTTGIGKTIDLFNRLRMHLPDKMKDLMERLMEAGYTAAAYAYSVANYAGTRTINLDEPYWEGDQLVLTASGEKIAFIEFGSGVTQEEYPDQSVYSRLNMANRGQYGKQKGSNPPWVYVGDPGDIGYEISKKKNGKSVVKTWGNPPARGMYEATITVSDKKRIIEIAKEVFSIV